MKWSATSPAAQPILAADLRTHLRIDDSTQDAYLTTIIAAAVAHAEQVMQCSLIQRTITATFYPGEHLALPRGPIISVASVTVDGDAQDASTYELRGYGSLDLLYYRNMTTQPHAVPLIAVYSAGHGAAAADVPADILQVIKCHAGLLYENRETAADRAIMAVPFIEEFFRLRARGVQAG